MAENATFRLGFIGAGRMATALAGGFTSAGIIEADAIAASDVSRDAMRTFAEAVGARTADDNKTLVETSDVVILAVKPQFVAGVMQEISPSVDQSKLIISIVAGLPLSVMERAFPAGRLIRVMPNTPCLIGQGASAFSLGRGATTEDAQLVEQLLSAVGLAVQVEERLLDAVTGLSGSGPAFVYAMIEALSDGGVKAGLPRPVATQLAAATVAGAARMVLETGDHPGALKDQVTSPAGTTIAGLAALEDRGVRGALIAAVSAAAQRASDLAADASNSES